jgi:hypothetical protein
MYAHHMYRLLRVLSAHLGHKFSDVDKNVTIFSYRDHRRLSSSFGGSSQHSGSFGAFTIFGLTEFIRATLRTQTIKFPSRSFTMRFSLAASLVLLIIHFGSFSVANASSLKLRGAEENKKVRYSNVFSVSYLL